MILIRIIIHVQIATGKQVFKYVTYKTYNHGRCKRI